jgi:tetratricopeptide (TPR) repeat protein
VGISDDVKKCETWIRLGQLPLASRYFLSLPRARLAFRDRLALAKIARRLGHLSIGLRLLLDQFERRDLTENEKAELTAEYAVLLIQNGNVQEAATRLEQTSGSHPSLLLARAWCAFERWDYVPAIPLLLAYVETETDPYWKLAGRVNLAEAFLAAGRIQESFESLNPTIQELTERGFARLRANALNLRAQAYFVTGALVHSNRDLQTAMEIFGRRTAPDAILIRRQLAINQSFEKKTATPLKRFRDEAIGARAWESVRECDFQILKIEYRKNSFNRLLYGTPYPRFRERLIGTFGAGDSSESFLLGDRYADQVDLAQRHFVFNRRTVEMTLQTHALLGILFSDFYRPPNTGELFACLFPSEHFHFLHSPVRVHQCLKRLRDWTKAHRLPMSLVAKKSRYFLQLETGLAVRVPIGNALLHAEPNAVVRLKNQLGDRPDFLTKDVEEKMLISKASAKRFLRTAIEQGKIERVGRGPMTKYVFKL